MHRFHNLGGYWYIFSTTTTTKYLFFLSKKTTTKFPSFFFFALRYVIPKGGLFGLTTSAQYFSELIAWFGFFLMGFGPNGLYIFLVSFANLSIRASRTQTWYLEKFENYPKNRKKLIPFVW